MKNKLIITNELTNIEIADKVVLGENIKLGPNCKRIKIGYGSFIGDNVYIDTPELIIGEYTSIHKNNTIHGYKPCFIGNNCWIGQNCIIDSIGGTTIGNNVGIGAYSQLWSHIKFGDTLEGCRWNKVSELIVEDDVWFVGHCIVSPIRAEKKSMLLVGGVVTKDMKENSIYGGAPAKDLTHILGNQFNEVSLDSKLIKFKELYNQFLIENNITEKEYCIEVCLDKKDFSRGDKTIFFIKEREYYPIRSQYEYKFMKYLLYDKAKFNPILE